LIVNQWNQVIEGVPVSRAEPLQQLRYSLPLELRSRLLRTGLLTHLHPRLYTGSTEAGRSFCRDCDG
jgi:hypothetical protein